MKRRMASSRSATLSKVPRRMAWRVMIPKKISGHVEPGAAGWGEVHGDARVLGQPGCHVGVGVGSVVVTDDMQLLAGMDPGDLFEKGQELDAGVPGKTGAGGDPSGDDLERGEQCRRTVALVVMGLAGGQTWAQRQHRLRAVQCLDLRFSSTLTTTATLGLSYYSHRRAGPHRHPRPPDVAADPEAADSLDPPSADMGTR